MDEDDHIVEDELVTFDHILKVMPVEISAT
jgi:hypothetical protein